jgi:hypothetical protein
MTLFYAIMSTANVSTIPQKTDLERAALKIENLKKTIEDERWNSRHLMDIYKTSQSVNERLQAQIDSLYTANEKEKAEHQTRLEMSWATSKQYHTAMCKYSQQCQTQKGEITELKKQVSDLEKQLDALKPKEKTQSLLERWKGL